MPAQHFTPERSLTKRVCTAGRPICTLSLTPYGFHTDLNGDGVLDHAVAVTETTRGHSGHRLHRYLSPCSGYTFSGYPPKAPLFNGTICTPTSRSTANTLFAAHNRAPGVKDGGDARTLQMEAPPPVALPAAPDTSEESGQGGRAHRRHLVFLTSLGDLTMYDHVGTRRWQRRTQATWANAAEDPMLDRVAPTLQPLAMRRHAMPTAVLAAGAALRTRPLSCLNAPLVCSSHAWTSCIQRVGHIDPCGQWGACVCLGVPA